MARRRRLSVPDSRRRAAASTDDVETFSSRARAAQQLGRRREATHRGTRARCPHFLGHSAADRPTTRRGRLGTQRPSAWDYLDERTASQRSAAAPAALNASKRLWLSPAATVEACRSPPASSSRSTDQAQRPSAFCTSAQSLVSAPALAPAARPGGSSAHCCQSSGHGDQVNGPVVVPTICKGPTSDRADRSTTPSGRRAARHWPPAGTPLGWRGWGMGGLRRPPRGPLAAEAR